MNAVVGSFFLIVSVATSVPASSGRFAGPSSKEGVELNSIDSRTPPSHPDEVMTRRMRKPFLIGYRESLLSSVVLVK